MFYTERTSPGPGWAALDEPVQTPPSINDDEEDELEDELESQSGYRSSTPLKRKNSKHVIKQGTTKRSRRESPSSFNESSLSGSRDGGTSNVGASNNGLLRHRSESLSMDDLLTSRIIPSTQPITKTSTTAKSTNFAGRTQGRKGTLFLRWKPYIVGAL
ncbi:hypothetical protein BDQ17DRAFT_962788 [Cyathus striatus]|nr:hypothetical protein BDQ17DRAFT_962788 [Cyathus striatus]